LCFLYSVGLPARVTQDPFRDREFRGEVIRIAPYVLELEKQARTVDVDVHLDDVPDDVVLLVEYRADITVVLSAANWTCAFPPKPCCRAARCGCWGGTAGC
jgi:HlyD family secretion protein